MGSYDWENARIVAKIQYYAVDSNGALSSTPTEYELELPNSIQTNITAQYDILDSITRSNNTFIEKPMRFKFNLAVPANCDGARLLRNILVARVPFSITLTDADDATGTGEFKLVIDGYEDCRLTDESISYKVGNVPMISFNGMALRAKYASFSAQGTLNTSYGTVGDGSPIKDASLFQYFG